MTQGLLIRVEESIAVLVHYTEHPAEVVRGLFSDSFFEPVDLGPETDLSLEYFHKGDFHLVFDFDPVVHIFYRVKVELEAADVCHWNHDLHETA